MTLTNTAQKPVAEQIITLYVSIMKRKKLILLTLIFLLILGAFFIAWSKRNETISKVLSSFGYTQATFDSFNLATNSATIKNLDIFGDERVLISEITTKFQPSSLANMAVDEIEISGMNINLPFPKESKAETSSEVESTNGQETPKADGEASVMPFAKLLIRDSKIHYKGILIADLSGEIDCTTKIECKISFTANNNNIKANFKADGAYQVNAGELDAKFFLSEIDASDLYNGLIAKLLPAGAPQLENVAGKIKTSGDVSYSSDKNLTYKAAAFVDDISAKYQAHNLNGLSGKYSIKGSDKGFSMQSLAETTVSNLSFGDLHLQNGSLNLIYDSQEGLSISSQKWQWADGTLSTGLVTVYPLKYPLNIVFSLNNVELAKVISLFAQKQFYASGKISGNIPVSISGEYIKLSESKLSTSAGGVIKYQPDNSGVSTPDSNIATQALSNFHYDKLNMTIDSPSLSLQRINLFLAGSNPNLYSGKRIEFNLNINGNIVDMIRSSIASYDYQNKLQKQGE